MATSKKAKAKNENVKKITSDNNLSITFYNFLKSFLNSVKSLLKGIKPTYLFIGCIVLAIVLYFWLSSPDKYKKENKELLNQIEQIQKERNKIKDSLSHLQFEYIKLEDSADVKKKLLNDINKRMILIEQEVSNSFVELDQLKNGMNDINNKIDKVNQEPVKRVGDDLIKSLRTKIN